MTRDETSQEAPGPAFSPERWDDLAARLALDAIPPQGRHITDPDELKWLAMFCPNCFRSRTICECLWP